MKCLPKNLKQRFTKERDEKDTLQENIKEYSTKNDLTIDMEKSVISKGDRFRYVLADSWFACKDIVSFIHSRHI